MVYIEYRPVLGPMYVCVCVCMVNRRQRIINMGHLHGVGCNINVSALSDV